ncbi:MULTISPECIES: hypothetical protein [Pseudomonadales]|uniref:hypothetical protein n=1 Tax=Pseudomonadales TaxID=72274 RepID=UPI000988D2DE|nr:MULTISPECIES: hypothetical protein [Stutzerimonas stutzeri subgroup]OOE07863.1 hypothetical protein BSR09_17205 [Stutzerimonas degradans]
MDDTSNDPLCLVFIPALVTVLYAAEKQKGAPLTEHEVNDIRDKSTCMAVPFSVALEQEQKRGYADIIAENCWEEWQSARMKL